MKKIYFFLLLLLPTLFNLSCRNNDNTLPNIVLIFMDDMGYADLSCYGAQDYQTTNIDRLGEEGMRFTDFYASQAVCSASRASLLSGCYSERVSIQGALNTYSNIGINPDELLIPEMLKEKNYATGIFGKWHLGHRKEFLPLQHGFDEYVGLPYSNDMWPVDFDGKPLGGSGKRKSNYPILPLISGNEVIDTIATLEDQGRLTTIYTEKAVEFIHKHKNDPFFLYIPQSMVHVPIAVSEKFKGKSGKGLFADVMMEVDWSVGEIMKALEENGLEENTLVIFTSDNGPWLNFGKHAGSAAPLREGKGTMWEGGPRVSTLMKWPALIKAGTESDKIASTIDILPTIAEIVGTSLPQKKIDGVSILPLLENKKGVNPREEFFYYYGGELIAVRRNKWKLVFPHNYRSYENVEARNDGHPGPYGKGRVEKIELYDLEKDVSETKNLVDSYPAIVKELEELAEVAREELGDRIKNIKGAGIRKPGRIQQEVTAIKHRAIGKEVNLKIACNYQYEGEGEKTLTNGVLGSFDFKDEQWLGFQGDDFEAIVDLGEITEISSIECGFLVNQGSWIFSPEKVTFECSSDNQNFSILKEFKRNASEENHVQEIEKFISHKDPVRTRYIKVKAKNIAICPEWHPGSDSKSWLFIDEIIIR